MTTTVAVTADQLSALNFLSDLRPADLVAIRSLLEDRRSSALADPGLAGSAAEVLAFAQQSARASIGNQLATERARIQTEDTNLATEIAAGSISGPKPFPTYLAGLKCASAQLSALKLLEVVGTRLQELRVLASGLESEMFTQPGEDEEFPDGDDDFRRLRTLRIHLQASSASLTEFLTGLSPKLSKDYALAEAKYYFGLSGHAFLLSKIQAQDHLISEGSLAEDDKKTPKALLEHHRSDLVKAAKEEQKEASAAASLSKGIAAGIQQIKGNGRGGRTGNQRAQQQQQQQQQQKQQQQQQQQEEENPVVEPPKKKPRKRGKGGRN